MNQSNSIKLYHGGTSVCSAKVRVGLAEKGLEWTGTILDLKAGDQFDPAYLKLNPNGVVPTLVDGDLVVLESSLILEYIDGLSAQNPLMPTDPKAVVATRHWLLKCIDIHAAVNTLTFATIQRANILAAKTSDEIAAMIARMPNPKAAAKRRDIIDNGLASFHVEADFHTLLAMFTGMTAALENAAWLAGEHHSMPDIALVAYLDRLDRLGFDGLWSSRFPHIGTWLAACRQRPSYVTAIDAYTPAEQAEKMRSDGSEYWPELESRWHAFLNKPSSHEA